MISRTFKLCLNAGTGSAPFINVSQTDKDEVWLFELYTETGERYIPSSGAIIGIKSDGHGIANTGTVDSEGRVVITETEQMTAAAGRSIFELSIDGLTHGTANFIVNVEKKPIDGAIMSDSDLSLISQAVDAAATIEDLIEGHDPDEVIADAVDAWLDAHPEATTTVEDGAITEAKLNDSVKTGVFEDMTVGTSLAVMNDEGKTDNLAYKFRQTGGDAVRELDEVHGGTIAWNQLADFSAYRIPSNANGITYTGDGSSVTMNGTASALESRAGWFGISESNTASRIGHKCLFVPTIISGTASDGVGYYLFGGSIKSFSTPTIQEVGTTTATQRLSTYIPSGAVLTNYKVTFICADLTQMFGSTVADAIYAMEQSSAGSGVAYFRSLFPNDYYAYNSGELVSVEGLSAHVTTESNLFDPAPLLEAHGWAVDNGDYYGSNAILYNKYSHGLGGYPAHGFKEKTQYTWEFDFYSRVAYATIFRFYYTDGTMTETSSSATTPTRVKITSTAGKTVQHIAFSYANTSTVHFSNIMLTEGTDGTYKPYQKHTYPLDSTLTLRGVPKWNNGLYFDGDIYRHDGSVSRRYGIVDLGTLNWVIGATSESGVYRMQTTDIASLIKRVSSTSENGNLICGLYTTKTLDAVFTKSKGIAVSASGTLAVFDENYSSSNSPSAFKTAMSGVYLVYELATPTTEQADPYQQYQICDGKGTEEYISTTVTPVGHSTFYPVDIVAKVNKLPSDFSTLIAPTEEGFKATRNYTAKQFLIVNNQLYRVTANIANGANIVPNTNVTAVTIADILTTLI